jgi:hypothetical protein
VGHKQIRIVRVPRDPVPASTARLDGNAVPSDAAVCPSCGAYVADAEVHAAHHDATDRWRQQVTGALNDAMELLLLARGGIPTDGKTLTGSGKSAGRAAINAEEANEK